MHTQERDRELIQVLEELLPFLQGKGACTADPLVSLGTRAAGRREGPAQRISGLFAGRLGQCSPA